MVKLAGLHIDRFGARCELDLAEFVPDLNVIHGPNGAGKTTIIQFLRWALFGHHDEVSRRYLNTGDVPAGGTITLCDGRHKRTLARTHQDGLASMLTEHGSSTPLPLPTSLSRNEFDTFFTINLDRPLDVLTLLRAGNQYGFALQHDQRQLDRIRQLTEEIQSYRDELRNAPGVSESSASIRERHAEKQLEIEQLRRQLETRRHELEHERDERTAELDEQQRHVDRLARVLENIDAAIDNRKQQLLVELQQRSDVRRETIDRREQRLHEIDHQIQRWNEILQEVRDRLEMVRGRIATFGDTPTGTSTDANDVHYFLRTLGFRIRDVEHDLSGIYTGDSWKDHEADVHYLRGLLGSALNSMRDDVSRLCQIVEVQQQSHELLECREELNYLCRTEKELSDLVEALNRQRHRWTRESELLNDPAIPNDFAGLVADLPAPWDEATRCDDTPAKSIPSHLWETLHDFRLRHLFDRRDAARARHGKADLQRTSSERVLRELEEKLAGLSRDARCERLAAEITHLEQLLREMDQRLAKETHLADCEDQLRRLREGLAPSPILEAASQFLRRLTDQEFVRIHVSDRWTCQVHDRSDRTFDHSQLSRGVQDQLILSLGLAIVSAYRNRGMDAPLVMNDVFGNLDQSGMRALAELLVEFSGRGQQIVLFTRHDHVRDLFLDTPARVFRLMARDRKAASSPEPQDTARPVAELPPIVPDPTYRWIAEWQRKPAVLPEPHSKPVDPPRPIDPEPEETDVADTWSAATLLSTVPTLDRDLLRFLTKLHISTVGEFLELNALEAEASLGKHGVTAEIVQRRQREILMMMYVDVTPLEAQVLVACGVPDPERLGRADEAVLLKRVENVLERPQAVERFGPLSHYSLDRIRSWIDAARRSNYRAVSRRRSALRAAQPTKDEAPTVPMNGTPPGLRFYLDINDPVVDAPSIGPKTAEKLNAIDIYSIGNLLDLDAAAIADRLDERRISGETVTQWQLQAQLVCCVPNLRGHDAQILVACGVEDPATLAALEPSSFLKRVKKFVSSKEGQRVLRNAKRPDLAEVTAWIEWAQSARQLQAA